VDGNQLRRAITLALRPDGSADVRLLSTYAGEEAIERRNDFFDLPKAEREQLLRKELRDVFPSARIGEVTWEGMDDASEQAKVSYHFELPGAAQVLDSRMLVPPRLFDRPSPFPNWNRTHPVYLRRNVDTFQEVRIIPPPGYQLEQSLGTKEHKLEVRDATPGMYVSSTTQDGGAIVHVTRLTTSALYIPPEDYVAVKRFYDQIAASERTYLVLRRQ
jgi:hypothetical protein